MHFILQNVEYLMKKIDIPTPKCKIGNLIWYAAMHHKSNFFLKEKKNESLFFETASLFLVLSWPSIANLQCWFVHLVKIA